MKNRVLLVTERKIITETAGENLLKITLAECYSLEIIISSTYHLTISNITGACNMMKNRMKNRPTCYRVNLHALLKKKKEK